MLLHRKSRIEGGKKHLMHINHKKPLIFLRRKNPAISIAEACEILITSKADIHEVY